MKRNKIVGCLPGFMTSIGPLRLFGSPLQGWQTVSMGPAFDPTRINRASLSCPDQVSRKGYRVHHVELISSYLDQQVLRICASGMNRCRLIARPLFPGDRTAIDACDERQRPPQR